MHREQSSMIREAVHVHCVVAVGSAVWAVASFDLSASIACRIISSRFAFAALVADCFDLGAAASATILRSALH